MEDRLSFVRLLYLHEDLTETACCGTVIGFGRGEAASDD